jgi:hypothetical protein
LFFSALESSGQHSGLAHVAENHMLWDAELISPS